MTDRETAERKLGKHEYLDTCSVMCVMLHSTVWARILELVVGSPSHASTSFAFGFYERKRITNEVLEKGEGEPTIKASYLQINRFELRALDFTDSGVLGRLDCSLGNIMDRKQVCTTKD